MKINPMHSVNAYRKQQDVTTQKTTEPTKKQDQLQISSEAKKMQESSQLSADRQEKISKLKADIDQGKYKVNANEVARKFYDFWSK
ncbi:flagellar biosynthesis anti-sigma factor FlgM [Evansella sp. AB-P1]|uniref:flagellar biosynthesis anti-sigma factor FlgM n=1 Tax=Evansella sp. AB-P1 TaxID=3037653 RepID=UPI002420130B|nr:flagellar biosynthesis anti-sigma factor FlgM [Evansella sp. AB-P1]MDG5786677.1 flagellar biosynthesis anti-sigma factor FlgM [Evansella sp. AB-P1]